MNICLVHAGFMCSSGEGLKRRGSKVHNWCCWLRLSARGQPNQMGGDGDRQDSDERQEITHEETMAST